jgi:hypothetical protein
MEVDLLASSDQLCPDLFLLASGQPDATTGTVADSIPEMMTIQPHHGLGEMLVSSQPIGLPEIHMDTSQKEGGIPGILASPAISLPDMLINGQVDSIPDDLDSGCGPHSQQHTTGNKVRFINCCNLRKLLRIRRLDEY